MFHRYSFSNFFSFRDTTVVSFRMGSRTRVDDSSFSSEALPNERLSKAIAVVGPNAAGKTNLLKPLSFLASFIGESFRYDFDAPLWVRPHFFSADPPASTFELEFELDSVLYRYELSVDHERVHREVLEHQTSSRFSKVFSREWDAESKIY